MSDSAADAIIYDSNFFSQIAADSGRSAACLVPLLLEMFPVTSVLDVGCGEGAWAAAFLARGVLDVDGVDGEFVDRRRLLIPVDRFWANDLTKPLDLGRRFDLVLCLEVAEHLPEESAGTLISSLARHGGLVVFSAAIPQQGGTHHINEQWPSYWAKLFARAGFETFDVLRPRVWRESEIAFWFRQNLLVFATGAAADRARELPSAPSPLDLVHPEQFAFRNEVLDRISIRASLRHLRSGVRRKALRRFARLPG